MNDQKNGTPSPSGDLGGSSAPVDVAVIGAHLYPKIQPWEAEKEVKRVMFSLPLTGICLSHTSRCIWKGYVWPLETISLSSPKRTTLLPSKRKGGLVAP
nr:glycophorin-C isoform X1 [Caretta caretta]